MPKPHRPWDLGIDVPPCLHLRREQPLFCTFFIKSCVCAETHNKTKVPPVQKQASEHAAIAAVMITRCVSQGQTQGMRWSL